MGNNLIRINLNQTISRFELAEIKKEKNRWIVFSVFCTFFILILFFNFFILNQYNKLISSRLENAQKLIDDSGKIRENYETTHPIGTIITFQYNDLTKLGVPRHPRYLRIRNYV